MGIKFNPLILSGFDFTGSSSGMSIGGAIAGSTPHSILVVDASSALGQIGPLTDGQIVIGDTGGAPVASTLTGTVNQISITNGAGAITLSLPQDIATTSSPSFASLTLSNTTNQLILGTTTTVTVNSVAPAASRVYTLPDAGANASILLTEGNQTANGVLTLANPGSPLVLSSSSITAIRPLKVDASKNVISGAIDLSSSNDVTNILPLSNGGTNKSLTANAGAVVYSDSDSFELTTVGTAGQYLRSAGTSAPSFSDIQAAEVEYDNTTSTLAATQVQAAIDELADYTLNGTPLTFAGWDSTGELTPIPTWTQTTYLKGLSSTTTTDASSQSDVNKIYLEQTLGDSVAGDANDVTVYESSSNIAANYQLTTYKGLSDSITIDTTADVTTYRGLEISANGDFSGNAKSISVIHNGDAANGYQGLNISQNGSITGAAFEGIRIDKAGSMEGGYGAAIVVQGTSTGQIEVISVSNSCTTDNDNIFLFNGSQQANSGNQITAINTFNSGDAVQSITLFNGGNDGDFGTSFGGFNVYNNGNGGVGTNVTGIGFTNTGAAEGITCINVSSSGVIEDYINICNLQDSSNSPNASIGAYINITGTYDVVNGLSVNVDSATASGSATNRKTAFSAQGGSINGVSPFSTTSSLPGIVDSGNALVTIFTVNSGSPISNTSIIANNFSGLANFNDNYSSDLTYGLGYSMVGFVGQLSIASGKTVDKVSMALAGASVPVSSAGGTIQELSMYEAKGLLPAGGTIVVDKIYGLKVSSSLTSMSPTEAYGVYVEGADAPSYFEGDIIRINGVDTSFPAVQGAAGTVLTNDGSGNLSWETTLEPGDISSTAFSAANNQSSPVNVTGFAFNNATVRSFEAQVWVVLDATTDAYESFTLHGIQKGSSWEMATTSVGDSSGVVFSITSSGQIQYTSPNASGFVSLNFKFRAWAVGV